ncbi:MAG TPA: hypothetical protein VND66_05980 [Acidobacteriaceae bacterium]|nr:hypothetical protein [Acidobacteriaceae bacterium]
MFDPSSIGAALGSVKTIIDLLKDANDKQLAFKINAEVANVQGKLLEVQQQALGLQLDNQELRAEIEKSKSYVQHHSVIWKLRSDGTEDGPLCPACIGEDREMRLVLVPHFDQTGPFWIVYCPKGHVDHRAKTQGFQVQKQESTYHVPKELLPENYFYCP